MARRIPALSTYKRAARAYASLFLSKENVKFITLGQKEIGGKITDHMAIKVYVKEKIDESNLDERELVQKSVKAIYSSGKPLKNHIPTDIIPIGKGKFSLLGIKGGDSFHIEGVGIQGTCAIADSNGFIYTNAHVAAIQSGQNIALRVTAIFNNTRFFGEIQKIAHLYPVGNRMDAAIMKLAGFNQQDEWHVLGRPIREPVYQLDNGEFEYFSGNDHVKLIAPELSTHPISFILENGIEYGFEGFYMLQVATTSPNQPRPGHSGSMLLKYGGGVWHPVGLVFGSAEFGSRTFVCVFSWDDVRRWINSA